MRSRVPGASWATRSRWPGGRGPHDRVRFRLYSYPDFYPRQTAGASAADVDALARAWSELGDAFLVAGRPGDARYCLRGARAAHAWSPSLYMLGAHLTEVPPASCFWVWTYGSCRVTKGCLLGRCVWLRCGLCAVSACRVPPGLSAVIYNSRRKQQPGPYNASAWCKHTCWASQ